MANEHNLEPPIKKAQKNKSPKQRRCRISLRLYNCLVEQKHFDDSYGVGIFEIGPF